MIKRFLSLFAKPVPAPKVPAPAVAKISPVVLALAKQAPPKVEIAPYEPPAGVIPAALAMDSMAMDATPYDWVNSVYSGQHFKGYPHLALLSQQPEYRKMAETIAKQMTRKWIKVKAKGEADKSERVTQMEESLEEFNVRAIFRKAAELDGLFGRGQIYIDVKTPGGIPAQADPEELKTPLLRSPAKIKKDSLIGFRVVEPVWTYPSSYNSDNPLAADYYKPTAWFVMGKTVHASRMMMFASREVPDLLKASYNFGGLSMSQLAEPYVNNWLRTRDSVSDMVHSFSVSGIKTNMGAALSGSTDSSMLDRATLFNAMRDNRGVFMLDKDTEEFFTFNTPLSTLDALQAQAQEQMSSVSNIPLVFLLGIAPSGLNATSEGEIKVFHSYILSMQEALFTDPLNRVFDIIQLSKFGAIDPDITFEFAPLDEMDPLQQAQIRAEDASTDAVLIGAGAISADDSRARLAADPASLYAGLEINEDLGGPDGLSAQDKNLTFDGEHWITVSGARVLIDENGEVIGGAGGKLDGKTMHPNSKSENRINEKTSAFKDPDFKPHESKAENSNAVTKLKPEVSIKISELRSSISKKQDSYLSEFNKSMESESSVTPSAAQTDIEESELADLIANNPREALHSEAVGQRDKSHWADNLGRVESAKKSIDILENGGSIEEARAALKETKQDRDDKKAKSDYEELDAKMRSSGEWEIVPEPTDWAGIKSLEKDGFMPYAKNKDGEPVVSKLGGYIYAKKK